MNSRWVDDSNAALLTDLYEFTMLQSYFAEGMNDSDVMEVLDEQEALRMAIETAQPNDLIVDFLDRVDVSRRLVEELRRAHVERQPEAVYAAR